VLRSWDTYLILLSERPITTDAVAAVRSFARAMSFDLVWLPGMKAEEANQFNLLSQPVYHLLTAEMKTRMETSKKSEVGSADPFDVRPVTDDRPYPGHFVPWRSLPRLLAGFGPGVTAGLLGGEAVVLVAVLIAGLLGTGLLVAPLLVLRTRRPSPGSALYFGCLGAGFILIELGWIKSATRVVGDPTIGFALTLVVLLLAAAAGGRILGKRGGRSTARITVGLILCALAVFLVLRAGPPGDGRVGSLPVVLLILGIILTGFLMGVPFPAGMRILAQSSGDRAYGWASNGVGSVVLSVLSAQIALRAGISMLFLCGAAAYAVALIVWMRGRSQWAWR
jgi:hypothetical protein